MEQRYLKTKDANLQVTGEPLKANNSFFVVQDAQTNTRRSRRLGNAKKPRMYGYYCFWASCFPNISEHAMAIMKAGTRIAKLILVCAIVHITAIYDRIAINANVRILILA